MCDSGLIPLGVLHISGRTDGGVADLLRRSEHQVVTCEGRQLHDLDAAFGAQDVDVAVIDCPFGHVARVREAVAAYRPDLGVVIISEGDAGPAESRRTWTLPESALERLPNLLESAALGIGERESRQARATDVSFLLGVGRLLRRIGGGDDVLGHASRLLCEYLGWPYAEAWTPSAESDALRVRHRFGKNAATTSIMGDALSRTTLGPEDSLPARAWHRAAPVLVEHHANCEFFLRRGIARAHGLTAAVAVRVMNGEHPAGVLVCFGGERSVDLVTIDLIRGVAESAGECVGLRRTQESAARSESLLERTFATIGEPIFVVETPSRRIVDCNDAAASLFGYAREELLGSTTERLHASQEEYESFGRLTRGPVERTGGFRGEWRMRDRAGEVFPTEHVISAHRDDRGRCSVVVSVVRDLRLQRESEMRLQRLRDELAHASRISAVGQMAAGIVHDVAQPLTAASATGALIERLAAEPQRSVSEIREPASRLVRELGHVGGVLAGLRTFLRKQDTLWEVTDMRSVVQSSLDLVQSEALRADVQLHSATTDAVCRVRGDRVQLCQVIVNLLSNAVEAVSERGTRVVTVRVSRRSGWVSVTVSDTGPGIPDDAPERVFDAFYTTKAGGLGIGLSVSRSIVEAHGGEIAISSDAGEGTSVTVRLPHDES